MNKKVIKYLIWTIIITAILILMPIKETRAKDVDYSYFKSSENLFCLNKGYPFGASETFRVSDPIEGNFQGINRNLLNYIITEASTTYNGRTSIEDYAPQKAIWKLTGANVGTNNLLKQAYAYNEFIEAGSPVPKIVKEGNTVAIYYFESKYSDQTYTNFKFGETTKTEVPGTTYWKTETNEYGYDLDNDGENDKYNRKRIYTRNEGINISKVKVEYELPRETVLKKYTSNTNSSTFTDYFIRGDGYVAWYVRKIGSYYRCIQNLKGEEKKSDGGSCNGIFNNCPKITLAKLKNLNPKYEEVLSEITSGSSDYTLYHCGNDKHAPFVKFNDEIYMIFPSASAGTTNWGEESKKYTPQNLLYGSGTPETETITQTIKFGLDLTINKTDSLTKDLLPGTRFKIELTNIKSIDDYQIPETEEGETQDSPRVVFVKTDDNGQIKLTGLLPVKDGKDETETVTIKITEIEEPTKINKDKNIEDEVKNIEDINNRWYYDDKASETIVLNCTNGEWTKVSGTGELSDSTLTVGITNQPYINLSGNVWEDAQLGEKVITGPDGIKNSYDRYKEVGEGNGAYKVEYINGKANFTDVGQGNGNYAKETITEDGLKGIMVELYSVKEGKSIRFTATNLDGTYSFSRIPRTEEGFKIIFKYNGITYVETPTGTDSKAEEIEREKFNDRFETISAGKSNDNTELSYTYNIDNKESVLNSEINGYGPEWSPKFQVRAQTPEYNTTNTDVNCGLVKKEFDLSIGTDVKEAELTINDKTTTYNYKQIMDGELEDLTLDNILQNNSSSKEDVIYNLYLYSSDYYYRISDYKKTDIRGKSNEDDYEDIKNLEAYVTYSVILKNQTTHNTKVDEFVYYYDAAYKPYEIKTNEYNYSIDETARKITFTVKDNTKFNLTNPNYRVEVEITFKVNEDSNSNVILKDNATNIAEITRYSTQEGGLIDKDSAPGNGITDGKITQYEDDTDEAKGLNIILRRDETRVITGTVFDDTYVDEAKSEYDKDGILNNKNTAVNDVIVQLIELKKIRGQYYEYIWQETRSGSNKVKTTERNGYTVTEYTNNVKAGSPEGNGMYEFQDFIPGDYIIRFIYGDGKTYDITSEEYKDSEKNVKTYNGQDYKSAIDPNYNKKWYNTAEYATGQSVARDNEARRLEVMAYSATVNETNGADLANKTAVALENTWMCAETSMIYIPVDDVESAKQETANNNTVSNTTSYDYTKNNIKVIFGDMNFGLALRPKTNIVLEKHITSLKITPSGTGVLPIVDAEALDITKIVNGTEVQVKGITTGLATIKSTAANRGFWQVATDVEELMQGAELEVEYTYVLRNDSEPDYLSNQLVNEYETNTSGYSNYLLNIVAEGQGNLKNNIKGKTHTYGNYLGHYYYTGSYENVFNPANADINSDGEINTIDYSTIKGILAGNNSSYLESNPNKGDVNNDGKVDTQDFSNFKIYLAGMIDENYDRLVPSRVEAFEEALNNDLTFDETVATSFVIAREDSKENVYGVNKGEGTKEIEIDTVVKNATTSKYLTPKIITDYTTDTADWTKTITLKTTLATVGGGKLGANLQSNIAEILQYSNAAGRKDMTATPANLSYVHSDDTDMTMESDNERDEFWAESIIITKPTGEDKITPIQIALITISAIAALGAGIILIKKIVLKK